MGDAVCSFNPVYGQGMSVALAEARALGDCLAAGDRELAAAFLPRGRAHHRRPVGDRDRRGWRYPQVEGRRPPGFAVISRYMARAHRAATRDPVVLRRFFEVASLLAPPPAMLAPAIAWRVLLRGAGATNRASPARKVGAV